MALQLFSLMAVEGQKQPLHFPVELTILVQRKHKDCARLTTCLMNNYLIHI